MFRQIKKWVEKRGIQKIYVNVTTLIWAPKDSGSWFILSKSQGHFQTGSNRLKWRYQWENAEIGRSLLEIHRYLVCTEMYKIVRFVTHICTLTDLYFSFDLAAKSGSKICLFNRISHMYWYSTLKLENWVMVSHYGNPANPISTE